MSSTLHAHLHDDCQLHESDHPRLCESSSDLLERIDIQNGMKPAISRELEAALKAANKRIAFGAGAGFGASVLVVAQGDWADERGYLTTLPGHTEADVDGVVHIPRMWGEKCDSGPGWFTLSDLAMFSSVRCVIVGEERFTVFDKTQNRWIVVNSIEDVKRRFAAR